MSDLAAASSMAASAIAPFWFVLSSLIRTHVRIPLGRKTARATALVRPPRDELGHIEIVSVRRPPARRRDARPTSAPSPTTVSADVCARDRPCRSARGRSSARPGHRGAARSALDRSESPSCLHVVGKLDAVAAHVARDLACLADQLACLAVGLRARLQGRLGSLAGSSGRRSPGRARRSPAPRPWPWSWRPRPPCGCGRPRPAPVRRCRARSASPHRARRARSRQPLPRPPATRFSAARSASAMRDAQPLLGLGASCSAVCSAAARIAAT